MSAKNFHQIYANSQNNSVSELEKVITLYQGAIKLINKAKEAIKEGNIEHRYNNLFKASQVFQGLINVIDFEKGGEIAEILRKFYTNLIIKTLMLNHKPTVEDCDYLIKQLEEMLDAWNDIK